MGLRASVASSALVAIVACSSFEEAPSDAVDAGADGAGAAADAAADAATSESGAAPALLVDMESASDCVLSPVRATAKIVPGGALGSAKACEVCPSAPNETGGLLVTLSPFPGFGRYRLSAAVKAPAGAPKLFFEISPTISGGDGAEYGFASVFHTPDFQTHTLTTNVTKADAVTVFIAVIEGPAGRCFTIDDVTVTREP